MSHPPPLDYASPPANSDTRLRWLGEVSGILLALGILAAVIVPHIPTSQRGGLRPNRTRWDIASIDSALDAFHDDTGRWPTAAEGLNALFRSPPGLATWKGPYVRKVPLDSWGHLYQYVIPGKRRGDAYDLFSYGPDGVLGGGDDIGNW